jgi:hypothetical protein
MTVAKPAASRIALYLDILPDIYECRDTRVWEVWQSGLI